MLTYTQGDMFETRADIRVNTVNCVGVMGAGVALAFKSRYPEMFRDYKKACAKGQVQPGRLHVWQSLHGDWIINFPTKRHWRDKSRYEDIESGLKALHDYLADKGPVRVALPALGCGHGGLDWDSVRTLIASHLSKLEAEIVVFAPADSRAAGEKVRAGLDDVAVRQLTAEGVTIWRKGDADFPHRLRGGKFDAIYVKGNSRLLKDPFLAVVPSTNATDKEIAAATVTTTELARRGTTIALTYNAQLSRSLGRAVANAGGKMILWLAEGISHVQLTDELRQLLQEDRLAIVSATRPTQRWNVSLVRQVSQTLVEAAKATLITDPAPNWLGTFAGTVCAGFRNRLFYLNYSQGGLASPILQKLHARRVGRSSETGQPNVSPILSSLDEASSNLAEDFEKLPPGAHESQPSHANEAPPESSVTWEGQISPDEWDIFYARVLSKLAPNHELRLTLRVEALSDDNAAEADLEEIRRVFSSFKISPRREDLGKMPPGP